MFLASFPAGPWQANCYLVGPAHGGPCVIIDPGMDASADVRATVTRHGLTPAGVLLTHGHIDHIASAAALGDAYGVPCWIHEADRSFLTRPALGLSPQGAQLVRQLIPGGELAEPADLRFVAHAEELVVAGMRFAVVHAPGHTPGSVLYVVEYDDREDDTHPVSHLAFTGDVLFSGSIGRTDLPTGDQAAMLDTLARRVLTLPDTAAVLPGHGEQTTIARERARNPYLQPDFLRSASEGDPRP